MKKYIIKTLRAWIKEKFKLEIDMDLDIYKRKRQRRKFIKIIFCSALLLYLFFVIFSTFYGFGSKKYVAKVDVLEDVVECDAVLIDSSVVYKAKQTGTIKYYKDEGERIKKGVTLARIYSTNEEELQNKLNDINTQIQKLQSNSIKKGILKGDLDKSEKLLNYMINDLQDSLLNKDFNKAKLLKNQLINGIDKHSKISGNDAYTEVTLSQLIKEKENIINQMQNTTRNYYSQNVGLISYKLDGLEEVYTLDNVMNMAIDKFDIEQSEIIDNNEITTIKAGQAMFKISNNNKWYIACKVNKSSINGIIEGKNINIRLDNKLILKSYVYKIKEQDDEALLIFQFDNYYYEFYQNRHMKIEIIKTSNEGLKIPISTIIQKDDLKGVYVSNINNIVRFMPIEIIYQNDEFAVVKDRYIEIIDKKTNETKNVKTIKMYDEIILNPEKVKDFEIIQ
ncbi:HlyD family efflux transporter periplasmic adaptor subunit [Abyssisolibacter fermentans]|uniref:HlyD family efflux transporter periplasmic adaptor subunit n=1 Tax=Abyssisolibacter fermentans TaxID=1766203 RepID=UPI0012E34A14|nr:HlyD family efflux transporter periplasmic adaptor subunit [Abyssisolibacter fermentans]